MRRFFFILPAALLLVAACHKEQKLQTKFFEQNEVHALAEGAKDSITVSVRLEYPVSGLPDQVINAMTGSIIGQALQEGGGKPDIASAVRSYIDATVATYRETNLDLLEQVEAEELDAPILTWEDQVSGYFFGRHGDILSYDVYSYTFEGGAHGISGDFIMNFDVKDGRMISEDEFFIPGYQAELAGLLSAHLREAMPDEDSYNALFVKDIEPNGNFRVSEDGVTYVYGPYELGPYYLGSVEVTVPWDELGTLVKDSPIDPDF